jgi:hypothetical protein
MTGGLFSRSAGVSPQHRRGRSSRRLSNHLRSTAAPNQRLGRILPADRDPAEAERGSNRLAFQQIGEDPTSPVVGHCRIADHCF